jgi:hypothetical protein
MTPDNHAFDREQTGRNSIATPETATPGIPGEVSPCQDAPATRLDLLWSDHPERALRVADALYAPDRDAALARPEVAAGMISTFLNLLRDAMPRLPDTPEGRCDAVADAIGKLLRQVRERPADALTAQLLAVALRPIRWLTPGQLTAEVCATLIDYQRGRWTPTLSRPQLVGIETALALTVASLPPAALMPFWNHLLSPDPMVRNAMLLGIRFMSVQHRVPQLLHGLERIRDHAARAVLVDRLEEIAEPSAIPTLTRLLRETAATDWTLSRQIARTIRALERGNGGENRYSLLRPAIASPEPAGDLLRPLAANAGEDHAANAGDDIELLRPTGIPGNAGTTGASQGTPRP